ncbi:GGDEF domain-containing protein [Alkalimarinus alittae]|uniref:diguanylate cyclase n=1 Tax=Alkalimarinus alittae TaxID=2961619 RepID=A0ABY6N0R8_9ALTE|nr:GGDEF domain-containing protein [Alkalimarinus alittae]UZE95673.1 GGDEF domain-containing protein [Alkalimarinus alittae]
MTHRNNHSDSIQERVNTRISSVKERDDQRVLDVSTNLSLGALFFLVLIGSKSHISGNHFHGYMLYFFGAITIANLANYHYSQNKLFYHRAFISMVGVLFLYLTASGGESNTGPLWFYVFPPLGFYIFGIRTGLILSVIAVILVMIIFSFPQLPFVTTEYATDFKIRFIATFSFVTAFAYILDDARRSAKSELIEMATLYEYAARTDELTSLSNRRDMKECLDKEFYRHQRSNSYFSIILIDIDYFKRVNDTYGHDAGDAILQEFSLLLMGLSRQIDVVSRWGGEEFLMLLPDTSLLQALTLAERLRVAVAEHTFKYKSEVIPVTMSAGVCAVSQHESINQLLKQADINLYEAKSKGRNRIEPAVKSFSSP